MRGFDHEDLDVYRVSRAFVIVANDVVEQLPRGRGSLADQLQRASTSIPINIAEGAGEYSPAEKARFYRYARRSGTECAAILDVCQDLDVVSEERYAAGRELLLRIAAMLTGMVRRLDNSGSGSGSGSGSYNNSTRARDSCRPGS